MKGYVCLFLLFVATAAFAQSNDSPDEAAVLNVQRQWLEASQKGNGEALRQIIDDSFVGSTPDNHIINKQSLFPPSGSESMFTGTHFASLEARVIGNTAVVFGTKAFPKVPSVRPSVDQQAHNNANNDGGHTDTNRPWLHNCHNCFSREEPFLGKAAHHVPNVGALWGCCRRVP